MKIFKVFIFLSSLFVFPSFGAWEEWTQNLQPEVGVEFPTSFGIHGKVKLNQTMYFRLGVGSSSRFLLSNMYRTNLTGVEKRKINLLVDSLADSLYSGFRLGFRTNRRKGFYGEAGYSLMSLGKGETSSNQLKRSIGRSGLDASSVYEVQSTVHNATLHGGYIFPVVEKVGLSVELGVIKPFFANVQVDYKKKLSSSTEHQDSKKVKSILKDVLVLTGTLWLSYIF